MSVQMNLLENSIKLFRIISTCFLFIIIFHLDVKAEGSAEVTLYVEQVFKTNSSRDVNDVFTYDLISLDGLGSMPSGTSNGIYSFTLAGTSAVSIQLAFINSGIYQYQINEQQAFSKTYIITAYVINSDESLSAQIAVNAEDGQKTERIWFEQTYTSKASDPKIMPDPPVQKTISGNPPEARNFTFTLTAGDSSCPMPEGSADGVKKITINGAGQRTFGTWAYIREGTYYYYIEETVSQDLEYTFDESVYTIIDFVEDKDGQLVLTRSVVNEEKKQVNSFIFNNKYRKHIIRGNGDNEYNGEKEAVIVDIAPPDQAAESSADPEAVIASVSNLIVGGNIPKVGDDVNAEFYSAIFFYSAMAASGCIIYLIFSRIRRKGN